MLKKTKQAEHSLKIAEQSEISIKKQKELLFVDLSSKKLNLSQRVKELSRNKIK